MGDLMVLGLGAWGGFVTGTAVAGRWLPAWAAMVVGGVPGSVVGAVGTYLAASAG